jgi:hypothetical protein
VVLSGIYHATLMYARIHMGVPLTLYDVCIDKGPFVTNNPRL